MKHCLFLSLSFLAFPLLAESHLLTGTIIGTEESFDYSNNKKSTTVNTRKNAFDGDLNTFFATYERSLTWVGLDLGTPHTITKVGWSPRNDGQGPRRVRLSVFEGANEPDFSDGVPLYLVPEDGTIGEMSYAEVNVTRTFRYVRYIGPNNARCNVAEVAFYGDEADNASDNEILYQPTNLPCVVVHVADNQEPVDKVNDLTASISIISENGLNELYQPGTFRLRGNASMNFEKKPYRIKFDKKQNVLDAPAKAKKWTLIANYGDKTLMRNIVGFELSRRFGQSYTPYIQPVDVFVNGEYKGCYQLCDQVEVAKDRVEIEEMAPEDVTGGYFIEVDAYAYLESVDSWFNSSKGNPVTIKSPADDAINIKQKNYISRDFNKLECLLFGKDFESETDGYRTMLDLDSFLRHFLIGELNGNTDTYWSLNMYKPKEGALLYTGPIWDLDLAFDNDNRTYPINNLLDWIYATNGSIAGDFRTFVSRIVKEDKKAIEQMKQIWADARNKKQINESSLFEFIDNTADLLQASQDLNFKRWNILNTSVHQNPKVWGSYDAEVNNIKNYVSKRIVKMDSWLDYDPSTIDEMQTADIKKETVGIYTLQGTLVDNPSLAGIYIVKYADGSSKIFTIK